MKLIATAVFAFFVGALAVTTTATPASAVENTSPQERTEATYSYVAQPGDSYSLIARKATQTYGKKFKAELSLGQILYVETHLTRAAGSPQLATGEKVTVKEVDIKSWVEKAQKLASDAKAAWQTYAHYADFSTDKVGQN